MTNIFCQFSEQFKIYSVLDYLSGRIAILNSWYLIPFCFSPPQVWNDELDVISEEATQWDWTRETPNPRRVHMKWRPGTRRLCSCLLMNEETKQASSKRVWWNEQTTNVPSPFAFMPLKCLIKWECNTSHILDYFSCNYDQWQLINLMLVNDFTPWIVLNVCFGAVFRNLIRVCVHSSQQSS